MSRGRPLLIGVSGVDGSGKSSLVTAFRERLAAEGLTCEVVWYRPGMGMGWADRPRRALRRVLGRGSSADSGPTMLTIARSDAVPTSRRGVVGWVWCVLVTTTFLLGVRRRVRRLSDRDVLVFDRHEADALVTLDVFYRGVRLAVPHALVRRFIPRVVATVYLDLPTDVAVARKPGDPIEHHAVAAQLAAYPRYVDPQAPSTLVVDATLPPDEVADRAWAHLQHRRVASTRTA